jgi:hypothetical protein
MKKLFNFGLLTALCLVPIIASAAFFGRTIQIIDVAGFIVGKLITVVVAIALVVFFWGLVKFIYTTSEAGKSEGKNFMIWGIIALFVMISVWGLVKFIQIELFPGIDFGNPSSIPNVPRR